MSISICPFVYWSQTKRRLNLSIDLRDSEEPKFDVTSNSLSFTCNGVGSSGKSDYHFSLDFIDEIVPHSLKSRTSAYKIFVQIEKKHANWWSRLTNSSKKLHWLKIDFDRWKTESEDELDHKIPNHSEFYGDHSSHESTTSPKLRRVVKFRTAYLVMYNLWQLISFSVILGKLLYNYYRSPDAVRTAYNLVGYNMKYAQMLQVFEIFHPLFGLTPGSVISPLVQVLGRNMLLFIVIDSEPRLYDKPAIFYLFIVWSLAETIRAPYYICRVLRRSFRLLTWLRYTAWAVLYPLGFLCEGVLYLRAIPYYVETEKYSLNIEHLIGFNLNFSTIIQLYLMILFLPGIFYLTYHMYRQRSKIYGSSKKVIKRK